MKILQSTKAAAQNTPLVHYILFTWYVRHVTHHFTFIIYMHTYTVIEYWQFYRTISVWIVYCGRCLYAQTR